MKRLFLFFFFLNWIGFVNGQTPLGPASNKAGNLNINEKKAIDTATIYSWVRLGGSPEVEISNNGCYFTYSILNLPRGSKTLVVQSTDLKKKQNYIGASKVLFSGDSRQFVFQLHDSLCLLNLENHNVDYIRGVSSFKTPKLGSGRWLACLLKNEPENFILVDLFSGKQLLYSRVKNYWFSTYGENLILQQEKEEAGKILVDIQLLHLADGSMKHIYTNKEVVLNDVSFDQEADQIAFTIRENMMLPKSPAGVPITSLWYFKSGMDKAVEKISGRALAIDSGFVIEPSTNFSEDGHYIYLSIKKLESRKPDPNAVKVNIWNYQDAELQSYQLKHPHEDTYTIVVSASADNSRSVIRLNNNSEEVTVCSRGNFALINRFGITKGDRFWLDESRSNWLVSLKDGSRTLLNEAKNNNLFFSPTGKYLFYFDNKKGNYYSYELKTGKTVNISQKVPKGLLLKASRFYIDRHPSAAGWMGWIGNDSGLLVSDNYDIWLLDLTGVKSPINLTNGYGRANNIKFWVAEGEKAKTSLPSSQPVLLIAFNNNTKYNGFYRVLLNESGKKNPELLFMGQYIYFHSKTTGLDVFGEDMAPIKARDTNIWIVKRCTFNEAPNYFLTQDFTTYKAQTNIQPHNGYQWITSELVNFQQLDGIQSQGVLFKPDNFDPTKKYPLLINYHDQHSHHLYDYPEPGFTGTAYLDIPWFVSRGYLVFTPDIYFKRTDGNGGQCAYNTIVAAARFLSQRSYIDVKKMAIAGHSFGGGLTNYIIAHTNIFAAAFEGAGASDALSSSLQLAGDGGSRLDLFELNKGINLCKNPELSFEYSPIMKVNRVTIPLLMFHCRKDGAVPWEQAVELFLAMRRLNKKVWLIEYDDGDHVVFGKEAQDLVIRVTQFFDYYLKDSPPPVWMTQGIPANLKGIDDGLELDLSVKVNGWNR